MSEEYEVEKLSGYYYLGDSRSRNQTEPGKPRYIIYDMNRWELLELWWVVFWAWLKG
jgi:hypothetical protein